MDNPFSLPADRTQIFADATQIWLDSQENLREICVISVPF
jgi:hypothetical protein